MSDGILFKQKTAYEMRMSDWSSDVCASDLPAPRALQAGHRFDGIGQRLADAADRRGTGDGADFGDADALGRHGDGERLEERRVGKEGVRACRTRGATYHQKKNYMSLNSPY